MATPEKWHGIIGKTSFNVDYLQSVTQKEAINQLSALPKDLVVQAWKLANNKPLEDKKEKEGD